VKWNLLNELFLGFFRSGILGYGGGPSSIPMVHKEVVETYQWMSIEEFSDVLALGNSLPGPIATKMAGYIGYRVAGVAGLITALLATTIPTVILMIILIQILLSFRDSPRVQGMSQAIGPVVGVMLGTLAYQFFKESSNSLGWKGTLVLTIVSFISIVFLAIHPAIIIGALILFAIFGRR
jgi:chromate transporter